MAVGVRLFQNRERPHFRLSNYRINNQYGRLHKNHSPDSHFCDSAKASRIAFAGRRGLTTNESKIVFESDFGGNLSARLPPVISSPFKDALFYTLPAPQVLEVS